MSMVITKLTFLTFFCIIFITSLMVIYFSKGSFNNKENAIYKQMLVSNLFGLVLQFLNATAAYNYDVWPTIISHTIFKLYLIYFVFFAFLLLYYTILIAFNDIDKINKILKIAQFVLCIPIVFLTVGLNNDASLNVHYSTGMAVTYVYIMSVLFSTLILLVLLMKNKNIKAKKATPLYLFLFLGMIGMIIQRSDPEIMIMCYIESFVCFLMYFTIENPDVKMLNEMSKNKELMEQGYEDKYNFLFEMTQEARSPLININNLSNALRMEEDPEKVKDGLITLNNMVRQLDFSINNILNISSLDISKIKVVDNKYDLAKMCHDLEVRIKPEMSKTVEFYLTMPKQIPTLVGDYMKIRQILYSLLINACKNTENGTINMKVNLIEKYDVARLVFNISDTGRGMSIEKINEILSATGSLSQQEIDNLEKKEFNVQLCQKVVKIMGGNLMIKSNVGEGTEIILTIDQKVYHEKDNSILNQYENAIANYRKVLIISQNKNKLGIIKKKLTDNHITYSNLYYGADAIDRIKAGKKFDFILVDDEMKEMSGFMTLKGMKEIKGFDTPVIAMLNKDKENIKDHYLDDGFSDYLLLDNIESELDRIIEKY